MPQVEMQTLHLITRGGTGAITHSGQLSLPAKLTEHLSASPVGTQAWEIAALSL